MRNATGLKVHEKFGRSMFVLTVTICWMKQYKALVVTVSAAAVPLKCLIGTQL